MADDLFQFATGGASRPDSFSGMDPAFHSALASMFAGAPPEIQQNLQIKSGYRSPERQAVLWENALKKYGSPEAARKWVAPPGNSQHNKGFASDLGYKNDAARLWAHENAAKYGLAFPLSNENWHVELAGARGGGHAAHSHAAPVAQAPAPSQMAFQGDPVAEVLAAAGHPVNAPQAMPQIAPQQGGLAGMFAPPVMANDPMSQGVSDGSLGSLAMLFSQQQQNRKRQQAEDEQAEAIKRAALFADPNGPPGEVYG